LGVRPAEPTNALVQRTRRFNRAAGKPPAHIEVAIVCRAELLLLGLERLISRAPGLRVVTYAGLPESAVAAQEEEESDEAPGRRGAHGRRGTIRVALLSDRDALDAVGDCELILQSFADEVVLLSSRPNIGAIVGCMGAGARAFIMEGDPPEEVLAAITSAVQGKTYMGRRSLEILVEWLAERERPARGRARRREEKDLLRLLAEGRSTTAIAEELGVAPKTVRNRLSKLYRTLGVRSRAAAVRSAEERGLLDPTDRGRG
jgi:DNA-binding NarL/FixJ family response regulator